MDHIPAILNEPVFQKGFNIAEVSHLSSEQYDDYLKSVLSYNEAKAVTDTAFADGKRDEKFETAKAMLAEGFDVTTVARITKLTESEIENLK
jgi:predicted transposase/invertase (TIGR01784 family)